MLGNQTGDGCKMEQNPIRQKVGDLISTVLTWEKSRTWDIGSTAGLFNNRLTGSFDYFIRYTKDMVGHAPILPLTLGVKAPQVSNCDLKKQKVGKFRLLGEIA